MGEFRSKYTGKFSGIGRMMQRPGFKQAMERKAQELLPVAESFSPVGTFPDDPHPGLYRASFRVEHGEKNVPFRGRPHLRPYGRLVNTTPYAKDVEYGTAKVPRHAVLRRTIDAAKAAHGGSS